MKRIIFAALLAVAFAAPASADRTKYWQGDVNGDDKVTLADLTALVAILNNKDNQEPLKYDHKAADVNGDTTVDRKDVTELLAILLGKTTAKYITDDLQNIPVEGSTNKYD